MQNFINNPITRGQSVMRVYATFQYVMHFICRLNDSTLINWWPYYKHATPEQCHTVMYERFTAD